jgi:hypothetical protein
VHAGVASLYAGSPPDFIDRMPYGYGDEEQIRADVFDGGFASCELEVVRLVGRGSALDIAKGYVSGTPLTHQLAERGADLATTAGAVARHIDEASGSEPFVARNAAFVLTAA